MLLEVEFAERLPLILADATLVEQALTNVVNNAALHTSNGNARRDRCASEARCDRGARNR